MDFLSHPRRTRNPGYIHGISSRIEENLAAYSHGAIRGLAQHDQALYDYIVEAMHRHAAGSVDANFEGYDADLKLYLPFDETSGQTAFDLSSNGNTGTATGTTIVDGVFGKARSFNGSSDYVSVPDTAALRIIGDLTLEAWIYTTDLTVMNTIFAKEYLHEFTLQVWSEGGMRFSHGDGTMESVYPVAAGTILINHWYHVAVVRNIATTKIYGYVNSILQLSPSYTTTPTAGTVAVTLGRQPVTYNRWFVGKIDEPRIYSRALSADEIYLHYLAGALKLGLI